MATQVSGERRSSNDLKTFVDRCWLYPRRFFIYYFWVAFGEQYFECGHIRVLSLQNVKSISPLIHHLIE